MYSYLLASFTLRSGHALHVKLDAYRPANNFVEAILLAVCKAPSAMKPNRAEMRWADMVDDNEAAERMCDSACKCVASGISVGLFRQDYLNSRCRLQLSTPAHTSACSHLENTALANTVGWICIDKASCIQPEADKML